MRWLFILLCLTACNAPTFTDEFSDRFCEEWKACTGEPCEFEDAESGACSYDEDKADQCLEEEWVCVPEDTELLLPEACYEIYYDCENA